VVLKKEFEYKLKSKYIFDIFNMVLSLNFSFVALKSEKYQNITKYQQKFKILSKKLQIFFILIKQVRRQYNLIPKKSITSFKTATHPKCH